jgi:hypothetical protein
MAKAHKNGKMQMQPIAMVAAMLLHYKLDLNKWVKSFNLACAL